MDILLKAIFFVCVCVCFAHLLLLLLLFFTLRSWWAYSVLLSCLSWMIESQLKQSCSDTPLADLEEHCQGQGGPDSSGPRARLIVP